MILLSSLPSTDHFCVSVVIKHLAIRIATAPYSACALPSPGRTDPPSSCNASSVATSLGVYYIGSGFAARSWLIRYRNDVSLRVAPCPLFYRCDYNLRNFLHSTMTINYSVISVTNIINNRCDNGNGSKSRGNRGFKYPMSNIFILN